MYSRHPVIVSSRGQQLWMAFAPSGLVILQVINKSNDSGMSSFKILRDAVAYLAAFSPIDLPIKFFRSAPSLLTIPDQATIGFHLDSRSGLLTGLPQSSLLILIFSSAL